jgi:glycosyltransferase involved in cell wall biosynthesis
MVKKIVVIEDSSKSGFGGGQRVTLDFIDAVISDYPNIVVIDHTNGTSTTFKDEVIKRNIEIYEIIGNGKIGKAELSSYSFSIKEAILFPFYYLYNIISLLTKDIRNNSPSVIFYATTKKAYLIAIVLAKSSDHIIFHAHSMHRKGLISSFFRYLIQAPRVTVVGVSDAVKNSYKIKRIIRVYNGVRQSNSSPKLKSHTPIVVAYIGSLISWKGIEYFLSAMNYLDRSDIVFHIYGSGNLKDALITKYQKIERIVFKGFSNDIGNALKSNIDILILPSISEEACPMVILEAFSYGVPTITTNIGGQFELIRNGGGISVNPRSPKEIARAINAIASEDYSNYSKNSLERKADFSIDMFKNNFLRVLNELD